MATEKSTKPKQGAVTVGHPVNVATGTLYHEFEDCELSGRIPLLFPRRYSTALLDKTPGLFGIGWHCALDLKIRRDLDGYTLTDASGESDISFNITDSDLQSGKVAINFAAFHELRLHDNELCIVRWNVENGDITRDFFPLPQADEWISIIRREDAEGNALLFRYDQQQLTEIIQQHEQRSLHLEYNEQGRLAKIYRKAAALKEAEQESTPFLQYDYDQQGRLAKFTNPLGASSYYQYDDAHRMINELTLSGLMYTFQFDKQGRCVYLSGDNDFDLHRLKYDTLTRNTEVTNSQGHVTTYYWNESFQVERVISPQGHVQTTVYDENDRIIAEVLPSGAATQYAYDELGNRCSITGADGAVVQYAFNPQHQVISITDPLGNQWQRAYDAQGRLVGMVNPLGVKQQFTYNAQGDLTNQQDGVGNTRQFQWDSNGNLLSATDWLGNRSNYSWDAFGNLTSYSDAAGHTTQMLRDRLGHLLTLTLPDGNTRQYEWDVYDNLQRYSDENKADTRWTYCACGSIEQEFKPDGNQVSYRWNPVPGQLAQLTNEKGELYQFVYDAEGRLVKETDFSGATIAYGYNADGQIIEVIKPSGHVTRYQYDAAGRITDVLHDDGSKLSYQYDARGLLTKANNNDCPVSFEYDDLGRLIRETQCEHVLEHEYDLLNNRIRRTSSLGNVTEFDWNPNGQIAEVRSAGFDPVQFEYDPRGYESKRQFGRGLQFAQQVDPRGRLIEQVLNQQSSFSSSLLQRRYQYDAASNLLVKQDSMYGTTKYTYDILERIESTLHPDQMLERFSYDANSNINSYQQLHHQVASNAASPAQGNANSAWQYRKGNQLLERDGTRYEYDADGQLINKQDKTGTTHYRWNRQGQLVSIQKPDGSEWFYRYDALSRRVEKRGAGGHTAFIWDGDVVLYEVIYAQDDANALQSHVWEYHPHDFSPLYKLENGQQQYFSINDQIGTPLELVDKKGEVAWSERLLTFGRVKTNKQNKIDCPIRFQGQWEDIESGFYYNRFRYYDSNTGIYISQDPIKLNGNNLNFYSYVHNPNSWIDQFGLAENPFDYLNQALKQQGFKSGDPAPSSLKQSWVDAATGTKYEVRAHPADPAYGKTGSIFRVMKKEPGLDAKGQGKGVHYLDSAGNWHHESTLKPGKSGNNPKFNPTAAKDTHIEMPSGYKCF